MTSAASDQKVVPADELVAEAKRMLGRVAGHTRTVTAAQKRLFEIWQNTSLTAGIDMSIDVFAGVFASGDTYEQIERHRMAIGRKQTTDTAGPKGGRSGAAGHD